MTELHITRGLPASGKTTLALSWLSEQPEGRARVNRDSFRLMFHAGLKVPQTTEALITKLAHDAVRAHLRNGTSVIVDDTNLRQRTAREWATLAKVCGAELVVHDLTHVTLDECLRRNDARPGTIPHEVITGMHRRYLAGKELPLPHPEADATDAGEPEPVEHDPDLPPAVIIDIDGTLAKCGDRDIYDGAKAHLDTLHEDVRLHSYAVAYYEKARIIIMSGRSEEHRAVTERWLRENAVFHDELHMRPAGDKRRDDVVKLELFNQHIRGRYNVAAVFDDRNQVVALWRGMGIRTYQVAEGNF